MLSDADIREAMASGDIAITNPDGSGPSDSDIQPASVDLHVGDEFAMFATRGEQVQIKPEGIDRVPQMLKARQQNALLPPGQFLLVTTRERVRLSSVIAAKVEGRSSIGRLGLMVHVTAGFVDPGFDGQLTLELYNCSPHTIVLHEGASICQLAFIRTRSPSAMPYGYGRPSKYQGQVGVQEAKTA